MTDIGKDLHISDDWISCRNENLQEIHNLAQALQKAGTWSEVVPGLDSIAIQFDPARMSVEEAAAQLRRQMAKSENSTASVPSLVKIPICYDSELSPDIQQVASETGRSVDEFIQWHQNLEFSVSMLGFLPGFAYLRCKENAGDVRRLDQPRQHVAAGSIGMVGNQNCLYSFASPGGWPIIGRTPAILFDPANTPPNLLQANQIVRFHQIQRTEYDRLLAERQS